MAKPRYIDPAGDHPLVSSVTAPPFAFQGVTCRAFPLRANMARLTTFCDDYLNMDIPADIVYFRPALPYVYLMVLNYGSMAPSSVRTQNFGWVAQNDVTFLVPLERWHLEKNKDKPIFDDWANVSPFIFVDSQLSLATGREVYGWPKVLAQIEADIPPWTTNPRSPSRLFNLSIPMFRHVYAGEAETPQMLIKIYKASNAQSQQYVDGLAHDLFYDKGNVIYSRTNFARDRDSRWVAEVERAGHRQGPMHHRSGRNDTHHSPIREPSKDSTNFVSTPILYNTALGAATQPVVGPFHFPDVTVQVYPLLAERAKFDKFLTDYLNHPLVGTDLYFKTFGSYVYLIVSACGDQGGAMWSDSNNIGSWVEREVIFCIPVKWYDRKGLISVGIIEPLVYANNDRAVTTDR
jgi:hypothetical protein